MNNSWNWTKLGLVLLALPLVATAAASAHLQIAKSSVLPVATEVVAATATTVGLDRVHTVALNRSGGVDGRIVAIQAFSNVKALSQLKVHFVKDGQIISQATTDADGVFYAPNIPEGIYSFIATGENGFAAYSVRVVSDNTGTYDDLMETVAVPQVGSVKEIIDDRPVEISSQSTEKASMDERGANRVVLKNGALFGRVLSTKTGKIENTQVHILEDGVPIAQVIADENGKYRVPDLRPGVYAMVAVGTQGIAAVAFEAIEFDARSANPATTITYVSTAAQDLAPQYGFGQETPIYTDEQEVYLIQPEDTNIQGQSVLEEPIYYDDGMLPIEYAGENIVCGGTCGSCGPVTQTCGTPCATTGGRFAGGGSGRLLAIGALTVGIIAIASNNNGNPEPASQFNP